MSQPGGVGGWWMASDGRWYPPEQHPDRVEPAPPEDGGPTTGTPPDPSPPAAVAAPSPSPAAPAAAASRPGRTGPPTAVERASFASTPLPPMPPSKRRQHSQQFGSRTWPFVVGVIVVMLAAVAGVAYFTLSNDKPSALPKPHLPAFPTVPANSGSSTGGSSGATGSPGSTGAATSPGVAVAPTTPAAGPQPLGAGAGGCTSDPAGGGCLNDGQPCPQSQLNTRASGPGGNFVCTEHKITSNGGGVLSLGYAWRST